MDNLTHSLVGLAAAKAGIEKLSPGATTLCILAANSPDSDVVTLVLGGRWVFLHHHRGITHSIIGAAVLAIALPVIFYVCDLLVARFRKRAPQVKFSGLLLASVLVTATHPLLDWTNNYGIRFLLPWNPRWSYGDFAFVIDPVLWLLLGGAAFLVTQKTRGTRIFWIVVGIATTYLVLIGSAGQSRGSSLFGLRILWVAGLILIFWLHRRGLMSIPPSRIARASLSVVVVYLAALAGLHFVALGEAKAKAAEIARLHSEQTLQVAAMPTLGDPSYWTCVTETNRATYKFNFSLWRRAQDESVVRYEKPSGAAAVAIAEAERDTRAQALIGFMRFPAFRIVGEDCATQTLVQFADLRYTEPGKRNASFSLEVPIDCPTNAQGQ
jgi:inner membrane protein